MKPTAILAVALTAAGLTAVSVAAANAAPAPEATVCKNTTLAPGTYDRLTVKGTCSVDGGTVRVLGKATLRTHAELDVNDGANLKIGGNLVLEAHSTYRNASGSRTHVFGDVWVIGAMLGADAQDAVFKADGDVNGNAEAIVALGCTPAHPCFGTMESTAKAASVPFVQLPALDTVVIGGSVNLYNVFNAAIDGATIHGDLISTGGGAGPEPVQTGLNSFSVKDDNIGGDVVVENLDTNWFGVIRTRVGGSVTLTGNQGTNPDSNEVVANKIAGDLACYDNTPPAQFGDAVEDGPFPGYGANRVGGDALGECADLTSPPSA